MHAILPVYEESAGQSGYQRGMDFEYNEKSLQAGNAV